MKNQIISLIRTYNKLPSSLQQVMLAFIAAHCFGMIQVYDMLFYSEYSYKILASWRPLMLVFSFIASLVFYTIIAKNLVSKSQYCRYIYSIVTLYSCAHYLIVAWFYSSQYPSSLQISYMQIAVMVSQAVGGLLLFDPELDHYFQSDASSKELSKNTLETEN